MGLAVLEQEVLKRWKSIRRLYTFLEKEASRINRECFGGKLPMPSIRLRRMKFCRDILSDGYVGAYYGPPNSDRNAEISLFPIVLLDKKDALIALAHEMVHHWEWLQGHRRSDVVYPLEIQGIVQRQFPEPERQYDWRLAHSARYLAKATEVASILHLPIKEFLFKQLPNT